MTHEIAHHFGGGVYAKEIRIAAEMLVQQHKHEHDHLSVLASGSVLLTVDGQSQRIDAPACLTIAAGKVHQVVSLTPVVWYCIHATECTDEKSVDQVLIAKE